MGILGFTACLRPPFFFRGSGYRDGDVFPWVVPHFSDIDAIESGIVTIPRVPGADDTMKAEQPTYHSLWPRIREVLRRAVRGSKSNIGLDEKEGTGETVRR